MAGAPGDRKEMCLQAPAFVGCEPAQGEKQELEWGEAASRCTMGLSIFLFFYLEGRHSWDFACMYAC